MIEKIKTMLTQLGPKPTAAEAEVGVNTEDEGTIVEYQYRDSTTGRWRNVKTDDLNETELLDRLESYAAAEVELRMRRLTEWEALELAEA